MPQIDKVERDKRVRAVMDWLLRDLPYCDIVSQIKSRWSIEDRQAKRYIREARKQWAQQEEELLEQKLRRKILSLNRLKNSMGKQFQNTPSGIRAILAVEREIIDLERLRIPAPTKIELSGKDGEPLEPVQQIVYVKDSNVDYTQLSDSVLEAIVKAKKKNDI